MCQDKVANLRKRHQNSDDVKTRLNTNIRTRTVTSTGLTFSTELKFQFSFQVSIPSRLAGAIIGPRGACITQIRQQSGASIRIDEPLPGINGRVITIVGNDDQIHQAVYLIKNAAPQVGFYFG